MFLLAACGSSITIAIPGGGDGVSRKLPRGYSLLYSPAPHAYRRAKPPEPVRRGEESERFELRDADCGGSDCGNARARAEIVEDRTDSDARLNRDIWYGWSFFNQTIGPVTPQTSLGTTITQWKLEGELPSIFRFVQLPPNPKAWGACASSVCTQGGADSYDVFVELDEVSQTMGWGPAQNNGRVCRLFSMQEARGRWTDLIVNTNFGTDGFGYLRVWVDGNLRCDYRGPLISPMRAAATKTVPTNRRGVFNSYTANWTKAFGVAPKPTLIAYFDEFRSGTARTEVDVRLHETSMAKPVD